MATQNPLEQEGTYPLPEAQLDRFFYKLIVQYSGREEVEGNFEPHDDDGEGRCETGAGWTRRSFSISNW